MPRILCLFPDLHGIPRGKLINRPVKPDTRIGFSPGAFAKDIYGAPRLFDELATPFGAADMKLSVRPDDCRPVRQDGSDFMFGTDSLAIGCVTTPDGHPHPFDMRRALRDFLAAHRVEDEFRVGAELEFYLLDQSPAGLPPDGQAYAFGGLSNRQECVTEILDNLDRTGIAWQDLSQENAPDQYEISLTHADPVEQADRAFLARMVIRHVASRHGLRATFIAVNSPDMAPSNLHLHLSRMSGGLDDLAASVQGTLHDAFTVYRPSANSRRTKDIESFASNTADVADGSRYAAIRVLREDGDPRVELRTPTSDANPYFAILAMLSGTQLPGRSGPQEEREFDFECESSLDRFLNSALAAKIWSDEGLRLFRRLKTLEFEAAREFGGFDDEREALLKVI